MGSKPKDALQDLKDFLKVLNKNRVCFIVVGAHAMSHWGYTRATGDLDILVYPDDKNSKRIVNALTEFGAPMKQIAPDDFNKPNQVLQIGIPPLRIDVLTSISGLKADKAFESSNKGELLGIPVRFISLQALIVNKTAVGRPKDLLDAKELRQLKRKVIR